MKAKEIQELIDFISKSGLDEVNIETEEFKIKVKKNSEVKQKIIEKSPSQGAPPTNQPASTTEENGATSGDPEASTPQTEKNGYQEIKSPMIGTFYRSANPDSEAFVSVGDKIAVGQTVCIVEAMKLFNEIESEVAGTLVKVLVDNSSPVEYDQPLFLIDPA
ncbi:MAG: acetyl-CoA carboxylase, biotin carboxyl carrier protein [Cyclobacteriaceae bacterium]|nr:MAG: acetyl-CoA carboxylase, biotin carboxyl carrier protein [Cyclobacteriaceae bacterium]